MSFGNYVYLVIQSKEKFLYKLKIKNYGVSLYYILSYYELFYLSFNPYLLN